VAQLENFRLKVFRTVAEHLSFRKAAEQLFLTQPAVTLQIKALEDDLGVRVFDRTGGRVSLTPQGRLLLRQAQRISAIIGEAEQELAGIHVSKKAAFLISAGTAICGGSAIAAVGPTAGASEEEMAVSLGAVFILNSVALFLFPVIGFALHMSQTQFGLWSALAIHDTSSVVGATARYGSAALAVGTTVKLARAVWIVPLSVVTAVVLKSKSRIQWPWFILFFCFAALLNTLLRTFHPVFAGLNHLGRIGLALTLFLIGTGLNRQTLSNVGIRPLLQGLTLWIVVAASTLALIHFGFIRI
jgi:uncharacterized integral membrane protein (TIGR00698 family)